MSYYLTSNTIVAEYVWIGGSNELRSKSRVITTIRKEAISVSDMPYWDYDGSSTAQAHTDNSEIILKPCALYRDPFRHQLYKGITSGIDCFLVLCSTFLPDGTPAKNNHRFKAEKIFKDCDKVAGIYNEESNTIDYTYSADPWFGFEQEYFIFSNDTNLPLGFHNDGKQGQYYCSVGAKNAHGRKIVEDHFKKCLDIGLGITGINAEVAPGQWEFQILGKGIVAADDLIIARYVLERVTEDHNVYIVWHPKPLQNGEWNGSGLHTNFSTKTMREAKDELSEIYKAIDKLEAAHEAHMAVYGQDNDKRLTGNCETSSYTHFKRGQNSCGDISSGDRSASIRIRNGYFEDRRPAANADPYLVSAAIYETVCL
jgi:glutamine synthetase